MKWDGWRAVADGGLKARTRAGGGMADALPELAGLADAIDGRPAILDGELIVSADGRPDFYALGAWIGYEGRAWCRLDQGDDEYAEWAQQEAEHHPELGPAVLLADLVTEQRARAGKENGGDQDSHCDHCT